jgi:hypothetical protein
MKTKFIYSGVHKNNLRDQEARSVTLNGATKLRGMFEEAKLRKEYQEELKGDRHE